MSGSPTEMLSRRDKNAEFSKLVGLISLLGPNINEVARRLGVFRETGRYRYKNLLRRGFIVQALPNYNKLGFQRLILVAAFSPPFRPHSRSILKLMHELCYVKGFEETAVEGWFIIQVAVPSEFVESCADLFRELQSLGVFSHLEVYNFQFVRTHAMMHEYYDFGQSVWVYDWSLQRNKVPLICVHDEEKVTYDKVDLLILDELQSDANSNISKLSKRISMRYRKLIWHYSSHVIGNNLMDGYVLNWTRAEDYSRKGRASSHHQKYLPISLLLSNVDEDGKLSLMGLVQSSPFLWFEASGNQYFASLYLPPETVNDFFSRLRELNIDSERLRYFIMSRSQFDYGFSHQLFDGKTKKWQFNKDDVIKNFESMLLNAGER